MNNWSIFANVSSREVNPRELLRSLTTAGYREAGGKRGVYSRLVPPSGVGEVDPEGLHRTPLIVPLDPRMADYTELMRDALSRIALLAEKDSETRSALTRTVLPWGDAYRFRRADVGPAGSIPWSEGESLYAAARGVLLAGAKARVSRSPHFGMRNARFAGRFLEQVLMGQTEVGSFVVTAFAPASESFPVSAAVNGSRESFTGREIGETIVESLAAAREAADHFHGRRSLAGFTDQIDRGISRELTRALLDLTSVNSDSDISVDRVGEETLLGEMPATTVAFAFSPRDATAFERASEALEEQKEREYKTVRGWLSVISRPRRGEPGEVRMRVLSGSSATTLRIGLEEGLFEVAAAAISADLAVSVSGEEVWDGRRAFLLGVTSMELVPDGQPGVTGVEDPAPAFLPLEEFPAEWSVDD